MITALGFLAAAGLGASLRAIAQRQYNALGPMPWGTLAVNVSGSFALGLVSGLGLAWLTVVGAGGLGAYTTFSSFAIELVRLHRERHRTTAAAYLVVMVVACVAAAWLGLELS